ncbi:ornithine cyclodeaminase family protein [Streptomyces nigra]|uniref:ornithine cyclodeaminase family protein n=1 Tax=Streptomyces nigra TaxID=1827580 RepID=UPI00365D6928
MRILDHDAVRRAYPMDQAIKLMARAMRDYSCGVITQPLRTILRPASESALLGTMPCHIAGQDGPGAFGVKAMVLKPENPARGLELHRGVVLVFDPDTGGPLALMNASTVTAVRTAAVSAVASRELAREDAGDLAILGSGVQARGHLEAMSLVRTLRRVRVWSRTPRNAAAFRDWAAGSLGVEVEVAGSVGAALKDADLVCTTTGTREPLVEADMLAPGVHVNAVGASFIDRRELSSRAVAAARVFVDSRESAGKESLDLAAPRGEGLVGEEHILAELGELLLGTAEGRTGRDDITLYKSLGLAAQDVISGFAIARRAAQQGLGTEVSID